MSLIDTDWLENNIDLAKPTYIKEQIEQDQKFQINTKLKTIYPKTKNQELFLKEMRSKENYHKYMNHIILP